jgi:hypothetical protein
MILESLNTVRSGPEAVKKRTFRAARARSNGLAAKPTPPATSPSPSPSMCGRAGRRHIIRREDHFRARRIWRTARRVALSAASTAEEGRLLNSSSVRLASYIAWRASLGVMPAVSSSLSKSSFFPRPPETVSPRASRSRRFLARAARPRPPGFLPRACAGARNGLPSKPFRRVSETPPNRGSRAIRLPKSRPFRTPLLPHGRESSARPSGGAGFRAALRTSPAESAAETVR